MECSSVDLFQIERQHYPEKVWSSYNSLYCSHHSLLVDVLGELFVFWFSFVLKHHILVISWVKFSPIYRCLINAETGRTSLRVHRGKPHWLVSQHIFSCNHFFFYIPFPLCSFFFFSVLQGERNLYPNDKDISLFIYMWIALAKKSWQTRVAYFLWMSSCRIILYVIQ